MMSASDYNLKQVIFVFTNEGDRISFSNDNAVVKDNCDKIRFQCSCYRIFALAIVGHMTITTVLIQKAHKFNFPILLMTPSLKLIDIIGHKAEGNFILREAQYAYSDIGLAKRVVYNKILNQRSVLNLQRAKDNELRKDMTLLEEYADSVIGHSGDYRGLMGIEGNAAKVFFRSNYNIEGWNGRKPRIKTDYINSTLDIGYTVLFNIVDCMLNLYGFDTYRGIYHREFYMRKSLTCDLMEPFRPLIDWQVRKAINLGQCKKDDFNISDGRYLLDISKNKQYVSFLMKPIMDNRESIFIYFQSYYRAFMKGKKPEEFRMFEVNE